MRRLSAIERLSLWTQTDLARAEMSGEFQKILGQPAVPIASVASAPSATAQPVPVPPSAANVLLTPLERATVAAALQLIDVGQPGQAPLPTYPQRLVILDTLRRLFGRTPDEALDQAVQTARHIAGDSFTALGALDPGQRQLLLSQLVHLATVDGPVSDAELGSLKRFAQDLQIPERVAATLLGVDAARSPDGDSALVCRSCSFELPVGACFCPGCGSSIAAA